MLKFIVDESFGLFVAKELQKDGYDVISIIESSPGVKDGVILNKASNESRIIITNDKDFGELIYKHGKKTHGIILFA